MGEEDAGPPTLELVLAGTTVAPADPSPGPARAALSPATVALLLRDLLRPSDSDSNGSPTGTVVVESAD